MLEFLFNKIAVVHPATLSKKKIGHSCFPVHFVTIFKAIAFYNTTGLILNMKPFTQVAAGSNCLSVINMLKIF